MSREIDVIGDFVYSVRYSWTTASFNERTGNMCTKFGRNHLTAPDFIGE